jgi:putative polyhydroxyalkanoate system protein
MATIHMKKKHDLDKKRVRQEVEHLAEKLSEELSIDYEWVNNRLVFKRTGANGFIDIGNNELEIEVKLNLVLSPLKGTIEKTITNYLDDRLA